MALRSLPSASLLPHVLTSTREGPHDSCARSEQHWLIVWRIVATIPPATIPRSLLRCRERFNGSYRASRCNAWRVEQIFLYARDSLPTTRKSTRQQPCVDEALQCVQMLVDTYGAELTDQVRELLPRLFGAEIGELHACR